MESKATIPNATDDDAPLSCEARYLFDVLRAFLNEREPNAPPEGFNEERFARLAKRHCVAAIVADEALKRPDFFSESLLKTLKKLRARDMLDDYAFETTVKKVNAEFEKNSIRYLPLKGAITKSLYPFSYQRTVCDYDVLVDDENIIRAKSILEQKLGYKKESVTEAHYCLVSESGLTTVELHHDLVGRAEIPIFTNLWSRVLCDDGECAEETFKRRFSDEDFYLHMLSHLARHWLADDLSLRLFVDVWLFNRKRGSNLDRNSLDEPLRVAGVVDFARNVERAAQVWFGNDQNDQNNTIIDAMARRVFHIRRRVLKAPDPFSAQKGRFRKFVDRLFCLNFLKSIEWEDAQRPWGTRLFWRTYRCLELTIRRIRKEHGFKKAWVLLFGQDENKLKREEESKFGFTFLTREVAESAKNKN